MKLMKLFALSALLLGLNVCSAAQMPFDVSVPIGQCIGEHCPQLQIQKTGSRETECPPLGGLFRYKDAKTGKCIPVTPGQSYPAVRGGLLQ